MNKEETKLYNKLYYQRHKQQLKIKGYKYYRNNRDEILRKYREKKTNLTIAEE